jgi:biopolymer transport protein ExbD
MKMNDFNLMDNERVTSSSDDNMIPLINIVFLLLIFFMVAGQIKAQPDKEITLPVSSELENAHADPLRLEIFVDGAFKLNGHYVELEQIRTQIEKESRGVIALFADARVTAKQLDDVLQVFANDARFKIKLYTLEQS